MGIELNNNGPLSPVGAKIFGADAAGNAGWFTHRAGGRPTLLIVGNSLAEGSCREQLASVQTTTAAEVKPGALSVTLTAGGVAAIGATNGCDVILNSYGWAPVRIGVTTITGEVLTLNRPMPRWIKSGTRVAVASKVTGILPFRARRRTGFITAAVDLCGGCVDVLPGHGDGGGTIDRILCELPALLQFYRPNFVWLQALENDIVGRDVAYLSRHISAAAALCLQYGATPIIGTPMPSTSYTSATVYDGITAFIRAMPSSMPGVVVVSPGDLYLDTTDPAQPRKPLAGWTDNIHPLSKKAYEVAEYIIPQLGGIFGSGPAVDTLIFGNNNVYLAGTGGTSAIPGAVVAATTTISAYGNAVDVVVNKTAEDKQRIAWKVTGASVSGDYVQVAQSINIPAAVVHAALPFKAVWRITFERCVNMRMIEAVLVSGSDFLADCVTTDLLTFDDPDFFIGKQITIETPAFYMPPSVATTVTSRIGMSPKTLASPANVDVSFTIDFMGLVISSAGEMPL